MQMTELFEPKNYEKLDKDPKKALHVLKSDIFKNYEEFKKLSSSPLVKSGMNKVNEKLAREAFGQEFAKYEGKSVWEFLIRQIQKFPSLAFFLTWELKLPTRNMDFSRFSLEQKINFLALRKALTPSSKLENFLWRGDPTSPEGIIKNFHQYQKNLLEEMSSKFKWKNFSNWGKLATTLKSDFNLSDGETQQCVQYLKMIEKNPQLMKKQTLEAGSGARLGAGIIIWTVLGALGYHFISNIGTINPETNIYTGKTNIEMSKDILRVLTQESNFNKTGNIEKKMYIESSDDNFFVDIGKRVVNTAQSKNLTMRLEGKLALQYDVKKSFTIELDHATGEAIVLLPKPKVVLTDSKAFIEKNNREFIHLRQFDQAEEELRQTLMTQVIQDAEADTSFYQRAKQQSEKVFLDFFQSLKPYNVQLKKVTIKEV